MSSPAAWFAAALVAGVAAGAVLRFPAGPIACALAASWLVATYAFAQRRAWGLVAAVVVGAAAAGAIVGGRAASDADLPSLLVWSRAQPPDTVAHLTGTIRDDAAAAGYGIGLTLDVATVSTPAGTVHVRGGVRLTIAGSMAATRVEEWTAGRGITCDTILREPLDFHDPGVASERARLARGGVVLLGTVKSAALVTGLQRAGWLDEAAASLRHHVRRSVGEAVGRWSTRSAGVVTAILIGDRSGLGIEDERRLQAAGTYHVIAISGGNIALLIVMLLATARWAGVRPRAAAAAAIAIVAFYGYLAGLAPSVARATLAGVVFLAARTLDHRGPAMNALGVAGAMAALAAPLSVLDPGFILSFGATVAIVLAADRLRMTPIPRRERTRTQHALWTVKAAAIALGGATLCAEIALAPPSARMFGRLSAAGLVLNFAAIPLMSIVQVAGLVAAAAWLISARAAAAAGWVAHAATTLLLESARLVDIAPWLVRDVPPPAAWLIVAWYAAWTAVMFGRSRWIERTALTIAAALLLVILAGPPFTRAVRSPPPPVGWTRVIVLDVGQGDATLVWPAGSEPLLVDAGGVPGSSFDLGRRVTLPALWAFGVSRLTAIALTHGDPDHIGGAPPLLRALSPRAVWEGIPVPGHVPLALLHDLADRQGIAWTEVRRGRTIRAGGATIHVLHPAEPDWERRRVRNDDSIVLDVRVGDVSFILPGDIGASVEPDVFAEFTRAPLTIVKAPHHGSAGSSSPALLDATRPDVVIFSAGQRNPFGHPAAAAVARYEAAGARIYRTDRDGAIVIDTDGAKVVVWTWSGRRELISPTATPRLSRSTAVSRRSRSPR
jgi:competence protein ComEC